MDFTNEELYNIDIALNIFNMNISHTISDISSKQVNQETIDNLAKARIRNLELEELIVKVRNEMNKRGIKNIDYQEDLNEC